MKVEHCSRGIFNTVDPAANEAIPEGIEIWTQRDYDIVQTLTRRVRVLSIEQAQAIWWPTYSLRAVRQRMRKLAMDKLVERFIVNLYPLLAFANSSFTWKPGQKAPDPKSIANLAMDRWQKPSTPMEVFTASRRSANLFGTNCHGLPTLIQRDQQMLHAQVYVHYRLNRPKDERMWVGEDAFSRVVVPIKDPFSVLISTSRRAVRLVTPLGNNVIEQIRSLHNFCQKQTLPYELW